MAGDDEWKGGKCLVRIAKSVMQRLDQATAHARVGQSHYNGDKGSTPPRPRTISAEGEDRVQISSQSMHSIWGDEVHRPVHRHACRPDRGARTVHEIRLK